MRYVKWTFLTIVVLLVAALLHYTLPQRDIVRVVNTYEERQDFGWNRIFWSGPNAGASEQVNRDVLFIQTVRENGRPMVYRNEDTGWGWPPYFKFDTANLQTEAADLISDRDSPRWAVVTHYGWRNELISIFPNAVAIRHVDSPDVSLFPWLNIVILTFLLLVILSVRQLWLRFRRRSIDPVIEDMGEAWDRVDDRFDDTRGAVGRFFDRIFGRKR